MPKGATELQARALQVVWELTRKRGICAYLVGGAVRDYLLERRGADIDVAVSREVIPLAREVADRLGGAFFVLDEANQVARVLVKCEEGGHLALDFALLRGGSIEEDLSRRDFTIDAMALPLGAGAPCWEALIDPFHGRKDLKRKTVRAVWPDVFLRDPARLLRAVRLGAELGFRIEPGTETLIRRDARGLAVVSGERIRDELAKMLLLPGSTDALEDLWRLGLLGELFPTSAEGIFQASGRLKYLEEILAGGDALPPALAPALAHPVRAWVGKMMPGGRPKWIALKLAALFYRLRGEEWEQTRRALSGLHFSRRENTLIRRVVEAHPVFSRVASEGEVTPLMAYRFFRDAKGTGVGLVLVGLAEGLSQGVEQPHEAALQLLTYHFEEYNRVISPSQLIDGDELMAELGLRPGPQVGFLLEAVREAQVVGRVRGHKEALALARRLASAE